MACRLINDCYRTLLLSYVLPDGGYSRNWCDKVAFSKKEAMQGCDVIISEDIHKEIMEGKVVSLVITRNDICISLRENKEEQAL